jgi:hypothetical protein
MATARCRSRPSFAKRLRKYPGCNLAPICRDFSSVLTHFLPCSTDSSRLPTIGSVPGVYTPLPAPRSRWHLGPDEKQHAPRRWGLNKQIARQKHRMTPVTGVLPCEKTMHETLLQGAAAAQAIYLIPTFAHHASPCSFLNLPRPGNFVQDAKMHPKAHGI